MEALLLFALALAFYNVGTIWAHEVDIFRSWHHVGVSFAEVQDVHWHKLPFWIFVPVGLAFCLSIALFWDHPARTPAWGIIAFFAAQALSLLLTAIFWGPWQAKLSKDPAGAESAYLRKILRTHWVRTALITIAGLAVLVSAIVTCAL
jgi:hypothetical protein